MRIYEEEIARLRFQGDRFVAHSLDVESTVELIAYKRLILECAKELWRRHNPSRERLPKGFEESFSLSFSEIQDGSATVPLMRRISIADDQLQIHSADEFDEAADLVDGAINAANSDSKLPDPLPRNVIPFFREFGKTLRPDETIFTRARRQNREAAYTEKARERLADWTDATYEDLVDLTGEVRMAQLDGGRFQLRLSDGRYAPGKFSSEQESRVLEALSRHNEVRLRVRGLAEFFEQDRSLSKVVRVDSAEIAFGTEDEFDEGVPKIWETVMDIGSRVPLEAWDELPKNLAESLDDHLYPSRKPK